MGTLGADPDRVIELARHLTEALNTPEKVGVKESESPTSIVLPTATVTKPAKSAKASKPGTATSTSATTAAKPTATATKLAMTAQVIKASPSKIKIATKEVAKVSTKKRQP
jgi:hypothetical protein